MKIYDRVIDTIGNTPLVELHNLEKKHGLKARLLAKVEFFNPGGSVKDRIAKAMVEQAEKQEFKSCDLACGPVVYLGGNLQASK